jgi:hypothetical protein
MQPYKEKRISLTPATSPSQAALSCLHALLASQVVSAEHVGQVVDRLLAQVEHT